MNVLSSLRGDVWKTFRLGNSEITVYRQGAWLGGCLAFGMMTFLYLPDFWQGPETPWAHLVIAAAGTYGANLLAFSVRQPSHSG